MGKIFARMAMGALIVIAIYNVVNSKNTQDIVKSGTTGGVNIVHALEGK